MGISNDTIVAVLSLILSVFASLKQLERQKENAIEEEKKRKWLNHAEIVCEDIHEMLLDILETRDFSEKYAKIQKVVLIYGSPKDIEILLHFKERQFDKIDNLKLFCCLLLLLLNIRYELTDERVSAELWIRTIINNYDKHKEIFVESFNSVAKECYMHNFIIT